MIGDLRVTAAQGVIAGSTASAVAMKGVSGGMATDLENDGMAGAALDHQMHSR